MSLKENDIHYEQKLERLQEFVSKGILTPEEADRYYEGDGFPTEEEIKGQYEQYKKTHETL